jgi:hypothetical protein
LTSTGRRTERRTRPDSHATVSRACVRFLRVSGVGRRRSPPRRPSDIRCHRRARYPRRKPLIPIASRPRSPFQRHTAKRAAFQKTGMPFAATTREGMVRGEIALSGLRAGSLAHAAHTFPRMGRVLCWALQVSRCGHPRSVTVPPAGGSRVQTPLILPASRLGLTTQACQVARPTRPSTGADCPARTDVGRSA